VPLRCLIVDDNAGFLRSARHLLEFEGLRVTVASTGDDALRQAEAQAPDVVLVDIDLGAESGFDVVERLDGRPGPSRPEVILISTDAEEDFAELIAGCSVAGFIPKSHITAGSIHRLLERSKGLACADRTSSPPPPSAASTGSSAKPWPSPSPAASSPTGPVPPETP
jgi:CheY-like chemotaxis protein